MGKIAKIILIFLLTTLSNPKEGHVSGSFSMAYGAKKYIVHFDNQRHKIYHPDTDIDALYAEFRTHFLGAVIAASGKMDALLKQAKAKKLPLVGIQLAWPEMPLVEYREIAMVNPASYPLIISLPVSLENYGGLYHFKFAFTEPVKAIDLKWLQEKLKALVTSGWRETEPKEIDLSDFHYPDAIKAYEKHALYAGVLFSVHKDMLEYYGKQLQRLLNKVGPRLQREINGKTFEKQSKINLLAMEKAFGNKNPLNSGMFNPWGPIQDDSGGVHCFRPRWQNTNAIVTALFASHENQWDLLSERATALIEKSLEIEPEHLRSIRTDLMILQLENKDHYSRYYYGPEEIDKGRMEEALAALLDNAQKGEQEKADAVERLWDLVGDHTTQNTVRDITRYYQSLENDYSTQNQAILVLAKIGTTVSAKALIELYGKTSLSDSGDSYFLRQEMLTALESTGRPAIRPLKKALAETSIKKDPVRSRELGAVLETIAQP